MTDAPATPRQSPYIVWGALLCSHLNYLAVALLIQPPAHVESPLVLPLSAVAVAVGLAALGLYARMLGDGQLSAWAERLRQERQDRQQAEKALLERIFVPSLMCWALVEVVSIMGLVLVLLGQIPRERIFLYVGAAVVGMLICRPRHAAAMRIVANLY